MIKPERRRKNMTTDIQKMKITDYDEAYQLWTETPGMGLRSLDDSEAGINRFLRRNPDTNFIYRMNGKLCAVILCGHDGRRGYIYHTAVDKEFRNLGIGRKLVEAVIEALEKEGIKKAALVVFKKNEEGNRFWESIGFKERDDLQYRNRVIDQLNK